MFVGSFYAYGTAMVAAAPAPAPIPYIGNAIGDHRHIGRTKVFLLVHGNGRPGLKGCDKEVVFLFTNYLTPIKPSRSGFLNISPPKNDLTPFYPSL